MNFGADAMQPEAVFLGVHPSVPALAKTIARDPPLSIVLLGTQARDEQWRLARHCAIALVANRNEPTGVSMRTVLPDTACRNASPVKPVDSA